MLEHLQKIASFCRELSAREDLDRPLLGPGGRESRFRLSFPRYVCEGEELPEHDPGGTDRSPSDLSLASLFARESLSPVPVVDLPPRRSFLRWLFRREVLPNRIDAISRSNTDSIPE